MIVTRAAVLRLADASNEQRAKMIDDGTNIKGIIKTANEMMQGLPGAEEHDNKLDDLIGYCSFDEMKQRLPADAFMLIQ